MTTALLIVLISTAIVVPAFAVAAWADGRRQVRREPVRTVEFGVTGLDIATLWRKEHWR